ncbi:MAG: hypothetical protein GX271_04955 [Clostridiales bacterium]|nr:hypothetical protein [Clostridiales bacterium]
MGTETQDNWNKYFGNKKTPRFNGGIYTIFIIATVILFVAAFLNKDYLAQVYNGGFGSSFNGVQMSKMVSKVNDIIEENKKYVNEFISIYNINTSSFEADDFIDDWLKNVKNRMNDLARIDYHKSYHEFMESAKNTLSITEQFITEVKTYKLDYMSINKGIDKIQKQSDQIIDELVKAFDQNRIVYSRSKDGGITYRYTVK